MNGLLSIHMRPDVSDELVSRYEILTNLLVPDVVWFEEMGISMDALIGLAPPKFSFVHFVGQRFEFYRDHPQPGPIRAYILLAISRHREPLDLLAWSPETNRLACWCGAAVAWGEEDIFAPRLGIDAVSVWRTPLGRLRHNLHGLVPLRPKTLLYHLLGVRAVMAEDAEHAAELRAGFEAALPKVLVRKPEGNR
jgi:hypothetical protein